VVEPHGGVVDKICYHLPVSKQKKDDNGTLLVIISIYVNISTSSPRRRGPTDLFPVTPRYKNKKGKKGFA
jgi:hypothetical protein